MRYQACEKLEIIQFVGQSHLSVRRTLEKLGIPRATFYRWYDLYHTGGCRETVVLGTATAPMLRCAAPFMGTLSLPQKRCIRVVSVTPTRSSSL